ncbi:hypothetical protein SADUNF_Sadunf07G0117300 [Salix dunnii]|uniref:Uncharacterized protein n=1 Tax=Salix dunnii TaxID=1413687 RepID=A0A835MVU0_9ROSI|nr:hypothetical protein SADUNF_Sadunf07G0117300 [Salix dunnii]
MATQSSKNIQLCQDLCLGSRFVAWKCKAILYLVQSVSILQGKRRQFADCTDPRKKIVRSKQSMGGKSQVNEGRGSDQAQQQIIEKMMKSIEEIMFHLGKQVIENPIQLEHQANKSMSCCEQETQPDPGSEFGSNRACKDGFNNCNFIREPNCEIHVSLGTHIDITH